VIVPVQCEYLSLRGLAQLQQTLGQVREHLNPDVDIFGILPTMYDGRTMHCREAADVLTASFGDTVFRTRIGKTVRFAEAPVQGQSALKFDSAGQSARWYRQVAREVLERDGRWTDDLERMRAKQSSHPTNAQPTLRLAS
jgi:chromosome partitioning protein